MPFHIPTLDEARKKHETTAKTLTYKKPPPKKPASKINNNNDVNVATRISPQNHQNKNININNNNQQQQQQKPFKINNPYAKKRKVSDVIINQNQTKMTTTTTTTAQVSSTNNNSKISYITSNNRNRTKLFIPNSTGKSFTSFTEAFGNNNNSSNPDNNNNNTNNNPIDGINQTINVQESHNSTILKSTRNELTTTTAESNNNGNDNSNTNFIDSLGLREHHAFLQPHVLNISTRQRGNPIIKCIKNVPIEYQKMSPDYIMSSNRCALFLSCKYHNLHPQYIHKRIADLRSDFDLRLLLCLVDVKDNTSTLLFLNKLAVLNNMTLLLAWSEEEAARYLETFKAYENKDASIIQRKEKETYADQVTDVLCAIPSVNKTDAMQLISQFGTLNAVVNADVEELSLCPGVGEKKVKRLFDAFHKPFFASSARNNKNNSKVIDDVDDDENLEEALVE